MKYVWLLLTSDNKIVAIYDDETLATKMAPHLTEKLKVNLTVVRRSVNQELSMIGVVQ